MRLSIADFNNPQSDIGQIVGLMVRSIQHSHCIDQIYIDVARGKMPELAEAIYSASESLKVIKSIARSIKKEHDINSLQNSEAYCKCAPRLKEIYDELISGIDGEPSLKQKELGAKATVCAYLNENKFSQIASKDLKEIFYLLDRIDVNLSDISFMQYAKDDFI